jgi:hypothetical protein
MALDRQAGISEYFGEAEPEIAIGEIDKSHAARSKTTASSIALVVTS